MALHAVIVAGGSGTRFWPASRKALPKQFLRLGGERSLIQASVDRVAALVPLARTWVVCGQAHAALVRLHIAGIPAAQILVEPAAKNTAPAIAYAAESIRKVDSAATVAVFPADQFVQDDLAFAMVVAHAAEAAQDGSLVTLGIRPTRAETGFGYIERGDAHGAFAYQLKRFIEKPQRADAEKYIASGVHYWNGGIFVFTVAAFAQMLRRHAPTIAGPLAAWSEGKSTLADAFAQMPSISIDYAVAEKEPRMKMLPLDAGWSDVGGWDAMRDVRKADADNNVIDGEALLIDGKNNIIQSKKRVCLIGVDDLIVVDTPDALLIMKAGEGQRVREIVAALQTQAPSLL